MSNSTYGRVVAARYVGLRFVEIYEQGYVRIAGFKSGGKPEKLLSIESAGQISKKGGFGRAVGAGLTLGANLLTPGNKGDLFLTIVTDCKTYTIDSRPSHAAVSAVHELESVGRAVLAAQATQAPNGSDPAIKSTQTSDGTVVRDLERLADMHRDGLLTVEEYSSAKARLLASTTAGSSPSQQPQLGIPRCPVCGGTTETHGSICVGCWPF